MSTDALSLAIEDCTLCLPDEWSVMIEIASSCVIVYVKHSDGNEYDLGEPENKLYKDVKKAMMLAKELAKKNEMTDTQLLQDKVEQAEHFKRDGRIDRALEILTECEAIIKRIKATPVAKPVTMADTFWQLGKQTEGTK